MKTKRQNTRPEFFPDNAFFDSASCQDCTGLIPAAPADEDEIENYKELYPFLPRPVCKKKE